MKLVRLALLIGVLIFGWLLGWSNSSLISIGFVGFSTPELPVFIFYCLFLLLGLSIGYVIGRLGKSNSSK